jgi:hypothetical protein
VSVELKLELTYRSATNDLVGRASVILEIDILFLSESVELDSGEWRLIGGQAPARAAPPVAFAAFVAADAGPRLDDAPDEDPGLANWVQYRSRFASPQATR